MTPVGRLGLILCAILVAISVAGCQNAGPAATGGETATGGKAAASLATTASGQTSSMKGYELYSWQDGGLWLFALLEGTNRMKTLDEIRSPATALTGIEALKPALENILAGQWVSWLSRDTLAFPPDDVISQVQQICQVRDCS